MLRATLLRSAALLVAATAALAPAAQAGESRLVCVYDPMGANGPVYQNAQAMKLEALSKGIEIELRADVEEKTAVEDLVAGKCDAALVTGVMTRGFGLASATVEAIGALPKYDWLKTTLAYLKDARMASKMVAGDYETAGIFPGGSVLLFTQDKAWKRASDLPGKSISIIGDDEAAGTMAKEMGISTKSASTATFGPMFNSGSVDLAYAPPTAYEPLELYRGLGDTGGIIDFPLSQLTLQLVIRKDRFPADFGQWGREYSFGHFDKALAAVKGAEAKIAKHYVTIPPEDAPGYEQRFLKVRLTLREKGIYDSTILGLMRRVRCKADAARAECAAPQE